MEEGVGFEPTRLAPTAFRGQLIQPLSHPSGYQQHRQPGRRVTCDTVTYWRCWCKFLKRRSTDNGVWERFVQSVRQSVASSPANKRGSARLRRRLRPPTPPFQVYQQHRNVGRIDTREPRCLAQRHRTHAEQHLAGFGAQTGQGV